MNGEPSYKDGEEIFLPPPRSGCLHSHTAAKLAIGGYVQRNTYYQAQALYSAIRRRGFDSSIRKQSNGTYYVYKLPKGYKKDISDASAT